VKKHVLWLALAVAALLIATAIKLRRSETAPHTMAPMIVTPESRPPSASPFAPPPNQGAPANPKPVVAIEDGKTIDFSSGGAIVKDTAQEKAIIEKAVKEMLAAQKNVSFAPKAPTAPAEEKKKSDGK
jgi:hypothetical protein